MLVEERSAAAWGPTLIELLVVVSVIGPLVLPLLAAVPAAREGARRVQCAKNLQPIDIALQNYHANIGIYPPAYSTRLQPATSERGNNWGFQSR